MIDGADVLYAQSLFPPGLFHRQTVSRWTAGELSWGD